jgi:small subunit ribosomal protein S6
MTNYELLAVLPGTLTEAEAAPVVTSIKETAEKLGATAVAVHDMGKSRLAYPMKHIRYGYFYIVQFAAESNQITEIQNKVRLINNILRLTVRSYETMGDASKITLTPLASVVNTDETAPAREVRRESVKQVAEEAPVAAPVSMEEIEEKLDQILEKDLEKV